MKASATIYNPRYDEGNVTVGLTIEGTANLRLYDLDQFIRWLKVLRTAQEQQIKTRWENMPQIQPFDSERV